MLKRLLFALALLALGIVLWLITPIDPDVLRSQLQSDMEK